LGKFLRDIGDELRLAAKQLAWLNTSPVPKNKKVESKSDTRTRKERMEENDEIVILPECIADFLLCHLMEVGPSLSTGLGPAPFDHRHIEAWMRCNGIELPPWQCNLLVQLSREYVSFQSKAVEEDCPSPWATEEQTEVRRDVVARALQSRMRALTSKPRKGKIRKRKKGG
jgi:hypothetical protein